MARFTKEERPPIVVSISLQTALFSTLAARRRIGRFNISFKLACKGAYEFVL
jgi:hypothetical protein